MIAEAAATAWKKPRSGAPGLFVLALRDQLRVADYSAD
jgi:hypothetical protein